MISVATGAADGDPGSDQLVEWATDASRRLLELVADLDEDQLVGPQLPVINPFLWEVGHVTWFQEVFVLRRALGEEPLIPHADAIWDSAAIPHGTRWWLQLPSRKETVAYADEVARRVVQGLRSRQATAQLSYIARYAVHHHDMHTEALTYTRQTLAYPVPALPGTQVELPEGTLLEGPLPGDVSLPGGRYLLGADRDEPFVHDNEKWVHPVDLQPFDIARAPVTQEEYACFVDDGGYRRRELWSEDGWAWRQSVEAEAPVYWRRSGAGWQRRDFDRWVALEAHRPVNHVC